MTRIPFLALVLVCSGLLTGCVFFDPKQWGPLNPSVMDECFFPYHAPREKVRLLRGDTAHLVTATCAPNGGLAAAVPVHSNWSVIGGALVVERPDGPPVTGAALQLIVVRGVRSGTSVVKASMADNVTRFRYDTVFVADSSAIVSIDLLTWQDLIDPLRVGRTWWVGAELYDATRQWWRGRPTEWTVSDTSILEVVPDSVDYSKGREWRLIRGKKAGTAEVRAKFLGARGSRTLTVKP